MTREVAEHVLQHSPAPVPSLFPAVPCRSLLCSAVPLEWFGAGYGYQVGLSGSAGWSQVARMEQ